MTKPSAYEARVSRLAALTVRVPSPLTTAAWLADVLGLNVREGPNGDPEIWLAKKGRVAAERALTLRAGSALGIDRLEFEVRPSVQGELRARVETAGIPTTSWAEGRRRGSGFAFRDPLGLELVCRSRERGVGSLEGGLAIRPRRLGHVNLAIPGAASAAAFYIGTLGLRLSEQIGESLYFLRAGIDHHNLGLREADLLNVHHIACEIADWWTMRDLCDHVAAQGYAIEYGPGRHGPGNNVFVYVVEPASGLRFELFAEMQTIPDDAAYEAPRWEAVDRVRTVNRWGPQPPTSFLGDPV